MTTLRRALLLLALPSTALADPCVYTGAKRAYLECIYSEATSATAQLLDVTTELLSLDSRVTDLESDVSFFDAAVATISDALDAVFGELDTLGVRVDGIDGDLAALEADVAQLDADLASYAGGGGGGTSGPAWGQFNGPAQTFANDTWTPVQYTETAISNNVRAVGRTLYFTHPGVYRVTLSYRNGTGPDIWTSARLYGNGQTRGLSVAGANIANSPELTTWELLATVSDTNASYEVQLGRAGGSLAVVQPVAIAGLALPAVQTTIQRLGDLDTTDAAQLEGPGQTFAASAWTPVQFNGASIAQTGWQLGSNGVDITFPSAGVWRVTLAYRWGSGADSWTAVRVYGGGLSRGQSAGTGQVTNSSELGTFDLLVNITDASIPYQIQVGRTGGQTVSASPTLAGGVFIPAIQATLSRVGTGKGSGQFEGPAVTFPANTWTAVNFSTSPIASNGVGVSGTSVTLPRAGTYRVTLSYRNGAGGDVWTGVRLYGDGATRGASAGTGNILNSSELFTFSFLATITNPAVPYEIQYGRLASTTAIATPSAIAGQTPPALQATIDQLQKRLAGG